MDREKVIRALETAVKNFERYSGDEYGREYDYARVEVETLEDAIALLKAQEQEHIVPIRRSAHAQGADDVWYECGKCGEFLGVNPCSKQICPNCGGKVKW